MVSFRTHHILFSVLLAAMVGAWGWYMAVMLRYPLSEPYPILRLHDQLADFAVLFALIYAALAGFVVWTRDAALWKPTTAVLRGFAVALGAVIIIAFVIPPNRSPDAYWTLLVGKGWVQQGVNPYAATAEAIGPHPWSPRAPFVYSMVYGPLWTYLVGAVASATDSLRVALILMKAVSLAALAASIMALWKLMGETGVPLHRRNQLMFLLLANPLLLQAGLVDVSCDVLTFATISWAMLLTVRGRHLPAAALLMLGGLVKYIPWLLAPIPLAQMYMTRVWPRRRDIDIFFIAAIVVVLAYLPFGTAALMGSGMQAAFQAYHLKYMAFPGGWVFSTLGMSVGQTQIAGLLLAGSALAYYCIRHRWAAAWVAAPAVLMTFGTFWVNPWYFLWVLPGAVGLGSASLVVLTGIAGILMPWAVHPARMGFILLLLVLVGIAWHQRGRIMEAWKKHRDNSSN